MKTITKKPVDVMKESELQAGVLIEARLNNWLRHHEFDSRLSPSYRDGYPFIDTGFPDLCLARDGVTIFAELKKQNGRVTVDQWEWLNRLTGLKRGDSFTWSGDKADQVTIGVIWRPGDWYDGSISQILIDPRKFLYEYPGLFHHV